MKTGENCWEFMKCGRQPGGEKADELGVCPAATSRKFDGVNHGNAAGRFCWTVAGTMCGSEIQGTFAAKFLNCLNCPFYREVERQEGSSFILTEKRLKEARGLPDS